VGFLVGCDSPNQEGVARLDCEVVWIFTEPSAILVMSTSLLRTVVFFLFKEAYFYADWLPVTARCAIRGFDPVVALFIALSERFVFLR
jgi:hypothetical protein